MLCSPFFLNLQVVHADEPATLADAINNVLSNIQTTDSPWEVIYGQVFGLQNQTVFDDAILQALNQSDYQDVIFIARLAELNGYTSTAINDSVITALENFTMCGSLPLTCWANSYAPDSFQVYDRYMINAYRYAQELNVSSWDVNQAFLDLKKGSCVMTVSICLHAEKTSRYGMKALENACGRIRNADKRTYTIYTEACNIGNLIAGGEIQEDEALMELEAAGRATRQPDEKLMRNIRDGIAEGKRRPRKAPIIY